MTDSILALVPTYGLSFLFVIALLAAIGVPLPSSLSLLVVGALIATQDMEFIPTMLTALVGAVLGDQIGFQIGRHAGGALETRLARKPSRAKRIKRAKHVIDRFGGVGVYLTRWLLAPIGPTTNMICGASNMRWLRYTLWDIAGEITWVTIYIGIGYLFRGNLDELATVLGDVSWLLIVAIAAVLMGARLITVWRHHKIERSRV